MSIERTPFTLETNYLIINTDYYNDEQNTYKITRR